MWMNNCGSTIGNAACVSPTCQGTMLSVRCHSGTRHDAASQRKYYIVIFFETNQVSPSVHEQRVKPNTRGQVIVPGFRCQAVRNHQWPVCISIKQILTSWYWLPNKHDEQTQSWSLSLSMRRCTFMLKIKCSRNKRFSSPLSRTTITRNTNTRHAQNIRNAQNVTYIITKSNLLIVSKQRTTLVFVCVLVPISSPGCL